MDWKFSNLERFDMNYVHANSEVFVYDWYMPGMDVDYDRGNCFCQFSLLTRNSFIVQFVITVRGDGVKVKLQVSLY